MVRAELRHRVAHFLDPRRLSRLRPPMARHSMPVLHDNVAAPRVVSLSGRREDEGARPRARAGWRLTQ